MNKNTLKLLFIIFVIYYIISYSVKILIYIGITLLILNYIVYQGTNDYNKELFSCINENYDLCETDNISDIMLLGSATCLNKTKEKIKTDSNNDTMLIYKNYIRLIFDNIKLLNLDKIKNIYNNADLSKEDIANIYKIINCN